jgi:hypothetical protein
MRTPRDVSAPRFWAPRRPTRTPAIGNLGRLPRRARLGRLAVALGLAVALLAGRFFLNVGAGTPLPPLPGAAQVTPHVLRGGQPDDLDLELLAEQYRVRAVVNLNRPNVEERAVTAAQHQAYLEIPIAADAAPTWPQLATIAEFLRRYTGRGQVVYLHDNGGGGSVVATTEMLVLLRGEPLRQVLRSTRREQPSLGSQQMLDVFDLAAALTSGPRPAVSSRNPYNGAHLVSW